MYPRLTAEKGEVLNSYGDYIDYNVKASLTDYTYYNGGFEYCRDSTKPEFTKILNKSNNINSLWGIYTPQIICASNLTTASSIFDSTVSQARSMGSNDVLAFDQEAFQKNKTNLNLTYAWPYNDPDDPYHLLTVTSIYGNPSYQLEIPEYFK